MITKPDASEYPEYARQYINQLTDGDNVLECLADNAVSLTNLIQGLTEEQLHFRYAEGKWTIKEVLVHIMDAERVFSYRALRFGRNDMTNIPGFDHNTYVPTSDANKRTAEDILQEFNALRQSTISLFSSFSEEAIKRIGLANDTPMSVRALIYMVVGHEMHHVKLIYERYLSAS